MLFIKYIKISVLLLILAADTLSLSNTDISALRKLFFRVEYNLWKHFTKKATPREKPALQPEKYLLSTMHNFSVAVKKVQPKVYVIDEFNILPSFRQISNHISKIEQSFEVISSPQVLKKEKRPIDDVLNLNYNITTLIGELNNVVTSDYFEKIKNETDKYHCILKQSQQQILYNLYKTIAITELKGYSIMEFADISSKLSKQEGLIKKTRNIGKYKTDTVQLDKSLLKVLNNSSAELWKCDPKSHRENETYIQITELLQGYFINKQDLDSGNMCRQQCDIYTNARSATCSQDKFCKNQRVCMGHIRNCKKIESEFIMCIGKNSRVEYAKFISNRHFGKDVGCQVGKRKGKSFISLDVKQFRIDNCDFCFCLCDEEGTRSDRYINLRPSVSNIKANRVVTGVRFKKYKRVIHLQIQEGKLLPYGKIDMRTLRWLPLPDYDITGTRVRNGTDFHKFSDIEREIDLDTLKLNKTQVVTGLRFQLLNNHINLEIRATTFRYSTGKLLRNKNKWIYNKVIERKPILLINPDIPIRKTTQNKPFTQVNAYVQLRETDMESDASQSTVPFFDAQTVASSVPTPLSGIGIYLKGGINSGGFIAPKIITYDYHHRRIP